MTTVRKRPDGRYEARLTVDGRRVSVYGATEAKCRERLARLAQRVERGERPVPHRLTVGEVLTRWYETERPRWKPRTAHDYAQLVERLRALLGRKRVATLSVDALARALATLPPQRERYAYAVLHRAFACAVRWGWLSENPLDRVPKPRYRAPAVSVPTLADAQRLLAYCRQHGHDWRANVTAFLLLTGLRLSEARALRWSDIEGNRLRVERTVQRIGDAWVTATPKTHAGRRTLVLGEQALAVLRDQRRVVAERRLRAGAAWCDADLVFPNETGGYLHDKAVSTAVRRTCALAGVEPVRPHQLRHWHASLALSGGAPLSLVSRQLGHANTHTTAAVYAHAVSDTRLVSEVLEKALVR